MDKRKAILHISDLHIADVIYSDNIPSKFQNDKAYLERFLTELLSLSDKIEFKYMIVTGDLTQSASEDEFKIVSEILNEICNRIKIDKKNVIITPGNHDINYVNFVQRLKKLKVTDKNQFYRYSKEKFQEFKTFYDTFFEGIKSFDPDKAIFDFITMDEENISFIGINSIYHESNLHQDHFGFINIPVLKEDLKKYEKMVKENVNFAVLHHTPIPIGDESGTIKNWDEAIAFFKSNNIYKFMCGHTHVSNSSTVLTKESIDYLITGSLGLYSEDVSNTFLVLEEGEDDRKNRGFVPMFYKWEQERGEEGFWQKLSNKSNAISFIIIKEKKGIEAVAAVVANIDLKDETLHNFNENQTEYEINKEVLTDECNDEIEKFLLDTIRINDLYISGHFHWSKNGRSHSFIKTNYFFENYECIEKIKICYLSLINRNKFETNLLVGYGMQGSVIGSLIAIEKNWEYTYCPAVAKKYSEYEKDFPEGDYRNITIVIDLIYTVNIIKWLIKKLKKKYTTLKKVNICTLFYTNSADFSLRRYQEVDVHFFYVYQIDINTCPYKNKSECIVYREKLDTIHVLYSEEEEK